jgi:hypothetical protein
MSEIRKIQYSLFMKIKIKIVFEKYNQSLCAEIDQLRKK